MEAVFIVCDEKGMEFAESVAWQGVKAYIHATRDLGDRPYVSGLEPVALEDIRALPLERKVIWSLQPLNNLSHQFDIFETILAPGDVIIDSDCTYYEDAIKKSVLLASKGAHYLDAAVASGVNALFVGGYEGVFRSVEPLLKAVSLDKYLHCGPVGAGFFTANMFRKIESSISKVFSDEYMRLLESSYADDLDFTGACLFYQKFVKQLPCATLPGILGFFDDAQEGRDVQEAC